MSSSPEIDGAFARFLVAVGLTWNGFFMRGTLISEEFYSNRVI